MESFRDSFQFLQQHHELFFILGHHGRKNGLFHGWRSSCWIFRSRRTCRDALENGVFKNWLIICVALWGWKNQPERQRILASRCSRDKRASFSENGTTARMPFTLLAATQTPWAEPQMRMPW